MAEDSAVPRCVPQEDGQNRAPTASQGSLRRVIHARSSLGGCGMNDAI